MGERRRNVAARERASHILVSCRCSLINGGSARRDLLSTGSSDSMLGSELAECVAAAAVKFVLYHGKFLQSSFHATK